MNKTAEERLSALFAKHTFPPVDVVIAVLEKSGRGEQELVSQLYEMYVSLTKGTMQILNLKARNMKTLAKVMEISLGYEGQKFEPIEVSESKFSFAVSDCPMLHVGKNVSSRVKGKFCDLFCSGGSRAMMDTVLGEGKGSCRWDKSLIKGASKCKLVYEMTKIT